MAESIAGKISKKRIFLIIFVLLVVIGIKNILCERWFCND